MTEQLLAQIGLSYTTNYIFSDLLSQHITDQKFSVETIVEDLFRNNESLKPKGDVLENLLKGIESISLEVNKKYSTKTFMKEEIELLLELLDMKDQNAVLLSKIEENFDPEQDSMELVEPYQRAEMIVEYFMEELRQNSFPSIEDITSIRQELAQTRDEVIAFYEEILPTDK